MYHIQLPAQTLAWCQAVLSNDFGGVQSEHPFIMVFLPLSWMPVIAPEKAVNSFLTLFEHLQL